MDDRNRSMSSSDDEQNANDGFQRSNEEEEDIWPEDVEKSFQEALKVYPPIGRRKILENGKMFGRNELIAKYIQEKTGKIRTRKQVSSHIQVLGKKQKKGQDTTTTTSTTPPAKSSSKHSHSSHSSHSTHAPSVSKQETASTFVRPVPERGYVYPHNSSNMMPSYPFSSIPDNSRSTGYGIPTLPPFQNNSMGNPSAFPSHDQYSDEYQAYLQSNFMVSLREFSAYVEFPSSSLSGMVNRHHYVSLLGEDFTEISEQIPLNRIEGQFFGLKELFEKSRLPIFFLAKCSANMFSSQNYGLHALLVKYESKHKYVLKCSTTIYSFGKAVVEKIQVEEPLFDSSYVYYFNHSPMCDYMVQFIEKLKTLRDVSKMNRVLENFSVLQVIIDTQTNTTLMCIAMLFNVLDYQSPRNVVYKIVPPARA